MHRLKAALVVAILVTLLTGSIWFMSQDTSVLSSDVVEIAHARYETTMREKLLNAEISLANQARDVAQDQKLIAELGSLYDKLLSTTPDQLKRNSNKWNETVYDRLMDIKKASQARISQHNSTLSDMHRSETGSILLQMPPEHWWGKAPDLLLAFASVPLNDDSIASILVAQGFEGKQLLAGKSYEKSILALQRINQDHAPQLVNFPWDRKMYIAVVQPILRDQNYIGSVVIGYELSKDMIARLAVGMPKFVDINLVYASPKFENTPQTNPTRIIYSQNDDTSLKDYLYRINTNTKTNSINTPPIPYDQIASSAVYTRDHDSKNKAALSKFRWLWDGQQETNVYIVSSHNVANARQSLFQGKLLIAGLLALLVGIVAIIAVMNQALKNITWIKEAFAKAATSGEPIDSKAIALLTGEEVDGVTQFTVAPVKLSEEESPVDWNNMMMDFDDEANVQADSIAVLQPVPKEQDENQDEAQAIYKEYMRLRHENHIDTPMDFETFYRRLLRNAATIKGKYQCKNVTFQVHVKDGNVLLKPKIVP